MIVSAAILYKGKTHVGLKTHSAVFARLVHEGIFTGWDFVEGFVDEYGDFLNRKQAAREAFKCKQIKASKRELFSSDLRFE
jgi:hypothetical protein